MAELPYLQNGAQRSVTRLGPKTNYAPSYMANVQSRSSSRSGTISSVMTDEQSLKQRPFSPGSSRFNSTSNLLLIVVAGVPGPETIRSLDVILSKRAITDIAILGRSEQADAIKRLKMDVYALIGRLRKEVSVCTQVDRQQSESEVATTIEQVVGSDARLQGILCCPDYDSPAESDYGILKYDRAELERAWQNSLGFIHATSKACIPHLKAQVQPDQRESELGGPQQLRRPFFVVTTSPACSPVAQIMISASNTLVKMLQSTTHGDGIILGHSDFLLPSIPIRARDSAKKLGLRPIETDLARISVNKSELSPDSPTKLWNIWSQVNEAHLE